MAIKRLHLARTPQSRITPAAIAAFKAGDRWGLARELKLKPWEITPMDVVDIDVDMETWPDHWNAKQARELLAELQALV